MSSPFVIVNLDKARYECTYGRGCDGVCCREGRPLVYAEEIERLDEAMHRLLPLVTPAARRAIAARGYLTERRRFGERMLRKADGWCVFFNDGCVLHRLGAADGDKFRYKPAVCALFPIQQDEHDRWYVRQKGFRREQWDFFCLDPANSSARAVDTLREEIALAAHFDALEKAQANLPADTQ